jgi:hypothetical protein
VPIPDDEQFEGYLKEFRPLTADPLLPERRRGRSRRVFVFAAFGGVCAGAIVLALLVLRHAPASDRSKTGSAVLTGALKIPSQQPLTIGRADALIARARSFQAAVDQMSFESSAAPKSDGKESAFSVLSKEEPTL